MDPRNFFKYPIIPGHKQYEALRAFYIDMVPAHEVARRFGYSDAAFNNLRQRFKKGEIKFQFTPLHGPKWPRIPPETRLQIIQFRKRGLSVIEIAAILEQFGTPVGTSSINRILDQEGFPKLPRRIQLKIGISKDNTLIPIVAGPLNISRLNGWVGECSVGGIFLFAPLIEHYGLPKIIKKLNLPKTSRIGALNYIFSMLALKLVGKERLSQINDFNFDSGLGLFAGLNMLPKSTAISTYSFRFSQHAVKKFMFQFVKALNKLKTYGKDVINLDFHTIQHYGDKSILEDHWAGTRGKRVKGVLTLIAQDGNSRCQLYVETDILRSEADKQILEFVKFWKNIRGKFRHTLVFDSKLTSYKNLALLDDDNIKFITIRRKGRRLVENAIKIPANEWKRITIDTKKRKYKNPLVHSSEIYLKECGRKFRQIIMKGNGREDPTFFITNDRKSTDKEIVIKYTKRWNVENVIEEAISFFNINSLSSPILIKVHLDVVLTMIADTLYYHLAQSLRGFESCDAYTIFRHFVNLPAKIEIKKNEILIKYPLRAHSPVLRSAGLDKWTRPISWLGQKKLKFQWG